jgi:hypothetical protein
MKNNKNPIIKEQIHDAFSKLLETFKYFDIDPVDYSFDRNGYGLKKNSWDKKELIELANLTMNFANSHSKYFDYNTRCIDGINKNLGNDFKLLADGLIFLNYMSGKGFSLNFFSFKKVVLSVYQEDIDFFEERLKRLKKMKEKTFFDYILDQDYDNFWEETIETLKFFQYFCQKDTHTFDINDEDQRDADWMFDCCGIKKEGYFFNFFKTNFYIFPNSSNSEADIVVDNSYKKYARKVTINRN